MVTDDLEEVTIKIPSVRVPELYRVVASWRSPEPAPAAAATTADVLASDEEGAWHPGDDEIADQIWAAGNDNAHKVYELLIQAAGQPVGGVVLAQAVGMEDGPNQFPGLLGAIGRTTWSRKRQVPWNWDQAKNTYTMPTFIADMFRKAASAG